jgi:SAM-dependent methyltransferase
MDAGGGGESAVSGTGEPGHDPTAYGASIADEYDALYEGVMDTRVAVDRLAQLAAGGPVLELGIGTGRLALPLVARGLDVHGVEASPAMVERLRTKPGGAEIPVVLGDFTDVNVPVPGAFSLVVLAFNTIFALPSEDAQLACFRTAARHLRPGGRFVLEAWVLEPGRFVDHARVSVRHVTADRLSLDTAVVEGGGERMQTVQVVFGDEGVRLFPANHTYAGPRELDLMAKAAGLEREDRWAGWDRRPFDVASKGHVSVYRKPDLG